jgi:topoisomerase-4 subunit A
MSDIIDDIPPDHQIIDRPFTDLLSERYLAYALSTITSRSLPDVRDGLKPVHRRLMFAMQQLSLSPATPPKKSARVVGDVIGKYHPHGDTSVYDALVRLAQDFSQRYPLIDGQGNFGNIDGDNAAAMRYTEARLTRVAELMLEGINEDAVDFRATYDSEGEEPIVLPSNFPNLLANGSSGIAVGMATNIPPFNIAEICAALKALIFDPDLSADRLVQLMPGPDFPTGGVLVEDASSIVESYRTGRGSFRLRARWEVEKLPQGLFQIIITEIPYQVQKSKLIERIADLLNNKKLLLLDDVIDESTDEVRVVLTPKNRNVDPAMLMEGLFKQTDLEVRFSLNMNVLDGGRVPRVMSLRDILQAFLDHRHEVLVRRSQHRVEKIAHRLEILGGYLVAYLNIDEVIRIIRETDEPKKELMARFTLSDVQAEAILNMRLRALRKLEEFEIRTEFDALSLEMADLKALLADSVRRWRVLGDQIDALAKEFSAETFLGKRRTSIEGAPIIMDVPVDALIEREAVTVLLSEKGWVRALRGHQIDPAEQKYKEGDTGRYVLPCETTDKLLVFASNGRFYTINVDKLPRGRGQGEPLRLSIDLPNDAEIISLMIYQPGQNLLIAANDGRGFRIPAREVLAQTRNGKQVLNVADGALASLCRVIPDGLAQPLVVTIGTNRKMLAFALEEVPEMTRGRGVTLQKIRDGELADLTVIDGTTGLSWRQGERTRTESDLRPWIGKRAQSGRLPPNGFPRSNKFDL